ncbi:hypothetical protein M378DRAFT_173696 [Amanita muscaria Koide BX008]|uniref:Uncharacterized protein n=1 Tax=Amanita muscaria (strain Koide BX008) TaxID=946122 RepID=A0A0C2RYB5_AMAMK|nr:hypothetical protein M378DRAFT_173696 [Amanita muscaria Koide BX008]
MSLYPNIFGNPDKNVLAGHKDRSPVLQRGRPKRYAGCVDWGCSTICGPVFVFDQVFRWSQHPDEAEAWDKKMSAWTHSDGSSMQLQKLVSRGRLWQAARGFGWVCGSYQDSARQHLHVSRNAALSVKCVSTWVSMLNNSHLYHQAQHDFERRGIDVSNVTLNLPKMLDAKDQAVTSLTKGIEFLFNQSKCGLHQRNQFIRLPNQTVCPTPRRRRSEEHSHCHRSRHSLVVLLR